MEEIKCSSASPQKVLLMYQAVIEMIEEGFDVNKIKVSDITARAGIGKGTAYEYFSSKEEIIADAILYDVQGKREQLSRIVKEDGSFREKFGKCFGRRRHFVCWFALQQAPMRFRNHCTENMRKGSRIRAAV